MANNGESSTGIKGVILGSAACNDATKRMKPAPIKPYALSKGIRLYKMMDINCVNQATAIIVSYPLLRGTCSQTMALT